MSFKGILTRIKGLITVKQTTRKYFVYVVIVLAILSLVSAYLSRRDNAELEGLIAEADRDRKVKKLNEKELQDQISTYRFLTDSKDQRLAKLRAEETVSQVEIQRLEVELGESQGREESLEVRLTDAHEDLARSGLKNSFLGEQITKELYSYFPNAGHLFFSETQEELFKVNPETANLVYAVIIENAIRVQLIGNLETKITTIEGQVGSMEGIIGIRDEEIDLYVTLVSEFNATFDNLEAALSLERRTTSNLERQIAIMRRKNLFERIMPSLNIIVGPYYDPFKNQGGFAVALGFGWRF